MARPPHVSSNPDGTRTPESPQGLPQITPAEALDQRLRTERALTLTEGQGPSRPVRSSRPGPRKYDWSVDDGDGAPRKRDPKPGEVLTDENGVPLQATRAQFVATDPANSPVVDGRVSLKTPIVNEAALAGGRGGVAESLTSVLGVEEDDDDQKRTGQYPSLRSAVVESAAAVLTEPAAEEIEVDLDADDGDQAATQALPVLKRRSGQSRRGRASGQASPSFRPHRSIAPTIPAKAVETLALSPADLAAQKKAAYEAGVSDFRRRWGAPIALSVVAAAMAAAVGGMVAIKECGEEGKAPKKEVPQALSRADEQK